MGPSTYFYNEILPYFLLSNLLSKTNLSMIPLTLSIIHDRMTHCHLHNLEDILS